jgi:hypothetical protein
MGIHIRQPPSNGQPLLAGMTTATTSLGTDSPGIPTSIPGTWAEARLDAIARGGYMATPTSAAGWSFMQASMYDWVADVDPVYNTCAACGCRSYQG